MKKIASITTLAIIILCASLKLGSAGVTKPAGSLLDVLPDGTAVALIDFQKIANSSLWTVLNAQNDVKHAIDKAQSEMTDLGLKLSDLHTVALVFPPAGLNEPTVAINGAFDQSDLLARLRTNPRITLTSEKYKGFDIYKATSKPEANVSTKPSDKQQGASDIKRSINNETSFVFYDSSTAVVGSAKSVRSSVDVKAGDAQSVAQNSRLAEPLSQNPSAAVRFALMMTPRMTDGFKTNDFPLPEISSISLVFGTIDVASGIDLNATLRSDNAEHAKAIADKLNGLLSMVKGLVVLGGDAKMGAIAEALKTVSIVNSEADVKITGNLPMDLLNTLLSSPAKKS
ncbi:MAG TPA: hypothetical protein VKN18_00325 [Blastocatellia bacterium]|nr:hypothetical protein [Blastocatellia bacterium]